jgi:hypothetical protein
VRPTPSSKPANPKATPPGHQLQALAEDKASHVDRVGPQEDALGFAVVPLRAGPVGVAPVSDGEMAGGGGRGYARDGPGGGTKPPTYSHHPGREADFRTEYPIPAEGSKPPGPMGHPREQPHEGPGPATTGGPRRKRVRTPTRLRPAAP